MSELDRDVVAAEAPVNPYSLMEAVNASSETAHRSWLIFLGLMSYLLVAVAGVSHTDLLLNNEISLPIVQVEIALRQFFLFAPFVLVLIHLGVITQLVMLARKTIEFDSAMRLLEVSDQRAHPLRLELHNFFFVQAIAGPKRSHVMSMFLHMMTWLTLAVLPVLLLLLIQTVFLPYHDVVVTWIHRGAVVADTAVLVLIGVFLVRAESSFFQAFFRTMGQNPLSFLTTGILLLAVGFFSFFVATVPGEFMAVFADKYMTEPKDSASTKKRCDITGFKIPFLAASSDGSLFGLFRRNLHVTDLDLVVDRNVTPNEPTLNLRGRELRCARLDRSDLHQADFTGANLDGASMTGTILHNVFMQCANPDALLSDDRKAAKCTNARGANFNKAKLSGANMLGMNLSGATFEEASLLNVDLSYAIMSGANFTSADLKRADMRGGVPLQGANFELALLQGANLRWASLQAANLNSAELQGAILGGANLTGAVLSETNLDGADLTNAQLQGANMTGAKIRGADLRGAQIWLTKPPAKGDAALADLTNLEMRPPSADELNDLKRQIGAVSEGDVRTRVREALAAVLKHAPGGQWTNPADRDNWQALAAPQVVPPGALPVAGSYKSRVTSYLGNLMCNGLWADGSVATGIVRQALAEEFRGDQSVLFERLQGSSCSTSRKVPTDLLRKFATSAAKRRGQGLGQGLGLGLGGGQ